MVSPSPLTGYIVENELVIENGPTVGVLYHDIPTIGLWALSCDLYTAGFGRLINTFDIAGLSLSFDDQKKLLALATSKIWRETKVHRKKSMVFPCDYIRRMRQDREFFDGRWANYTDFFPEMLWEEASELTLELKALETLNNFVKVEKHPDDGILLTSWDSNTFIGMGEKPPEINGSAHYTGGVVYGSVNGDAMKVLVWLRESGFVRLVGLGGDGLVPRVQITPSGHGRNDEFEVQRRSQQERRRLAGVRSMMSGADTAYHDVTPVATGATLGGAQFNTFTEALQDREGLNLVNAPNNLTVAADSEGELRSLRLHGANLASKPQFSLGKSVAVSVLVIASSLVFAYLLVQALYARVMIVVAPQSMRDSSWGSGAIGAIIGLAALISGVALYVVGLHRRR
jgi:hypothetical protein